MDELKPEDAEMTLLQEAELYVLSCRLAGMHNVANLIERLVALATVIPAPTFEPPTHVIDGADWPAPDTGFSNFGDLK